MDHLFQSTYFHFIPDGKSEDFWVITACNPDGNKASAGDNLAADQSLKRELDRLGLKAFRITGTSPDETHAEPGWGIQCDQKTALKLAKQYRQLAVFHFRDGKIDLVNTKSVKRDPLDEPSARIRDPRGLRQFTLWIGSPNGGRLDPLQYAGVCTRAGAVSDDFTIQKAEGCYRSRFEDYLLLHVAIREPRKVIELGHSLRCFLSQKGIGISHNGIYQRLHEWSDDELILEAFHCRDTP